MKINYIKLKNFGSYEGLNEFDFNIEDETKNVILIGGKNGAGKTTLFNAIMIALYGPTALGYQAVSPSYLNKIKRFINNNAFRKEEAITFISIDFDVTEDRGTSNYVLKRQWIFEKTKLQEIFEVYRNDELLVGADIESFDSYIKTLIPPQLFDLFFFDGEKISDFFLQNDSNKRLRDALLILCGYDSFEIMKQNFKRNIYKNELEQYSNEERKLVELQDRYENLQNQKSQEEEHIQLIEKKLVDLEDQRIVLENQFRQSGGLLADEVSNIKAQITYEEKYREEKNEWLRNYANDMLPFIITKRLLNDVKEQIYKEKEYLRYNSIKNIFSANFLQKLILEEAELGKMKVVDKANNDQTSEFSNLLANHIDKRLQPSFDLTTFEIIHSLSTDDESDVLSLISVAEGQGADQIKKCRKDIDASIKRSQKLRKLIENYEANDRLIGFIEKLNGIDMNIQNLIIEKERVLGSINELENKCTELEVEIKRTKEEFGKLKKAQSIAALSLKAITLLDDFIPKLIKQKISNVKSNFLFMFGQLMSKQNYVDDIEIDSDFNITLYRKGIISVEDLKNIVANIGVEGIEKLLGNKCLNHLIEYLKIDRLGELENAIKEYSDSLVLDIPIKVDINSFSKGEQQIYIMSLYWALVKLNNHNIPFIIDTPYARIDSLHRENITTKFFPSLSSQVIILSTDEEINSQYYALLKPFISKEYVISYSDDEKKTMVDNKYFFEVAS